MVDYSKRLVEVDEILNYLSEEDLIKIPEDIRKAIKDNKDKEYIWNYDETKTLKEQNLNRDTVVILSYLNMEYLLNEEQKKVMQQIHELNERKLEEEKSKKYNTNDIFKKPENYVEKEVVEEAIEEKNELVVYNESIFSKILKTIKKFFCRK